ncbi:MAG TPA: pyridoxal phosphate-dependent aminotransferase, partial [bacterium]
TEKVLRPNTKALVVVNPNNPTGSFLSPEDQGALLNLCQKREIAYISDEVFGDFAYTKDISTIRPKSSVLSFRLGGLSKSLGLPQLKLSWMVVDGPPKLLSECLERLELIADTYLSVNTPVQLILEELLAFAPSIQHQIKTRILTNRSFLERHLDAVKGIKVWPGQGGWYALIEVLNPNETDEQLAIGLLEKHKVLVHPGRFYDFPKGCFLVLSLLAKPFVWEEGVTRLKEFLASKG